MEGFDRFDGFAEFYAAEFHSLTVQLYAFTNDLALAQDVVQEAIALLRLARFEIVTEIMIRAYPAGVDTVDALIRSRWAVRARFAGQRAGELA